MFINYCINKWIYIIRDFTVEFQNSVTTSAVCKVQEHYNDIESLMFVWFQTKLEEHFLL